MRTHPMSHIVIDWGHGPESGLENLFGSNLGETMKKFQGLLGTALTYSIARKFMDKDPQMREGWGWFAVVFAVGLAITALISRWKDARSRSRVAESPSRRVEQVTDTPIVATERSAAAVDIDRDREVLRQLAEQVRKTDAMSFDDFVVCDKQLRTLFRESQDAKVRKAAFEMWDALCADWVNWFYTKGKVEAAKRLEELVNDFKSKHHEVTQAEEFVASPKFKHLLGSK